MTEADFIEAIRTYWLAQYAGGDLVLYDDDPQSGPQDTYWLRQITLYGPRDQGEGDLQRKASAVATLWRAFRHERINLDAPSVVGLTADGAFNRQLVTLGWRGDMRL